jgi:hypothetical protein
MDWAKLSPFSVSISPYVHVSLWAVPPCLTAITQPMTRPMMLYYKAKQ